MAWESKTKIAGIPLVAFGFAPVGIIAIGFSGAGVIVIAQFGVGVFTLCQFSFAIFGLMQIGAGVFVMGQLVAGIILAVGQAALGFIALGFDDYAGYYSAKVGSSLLKSLENIAHTALEDPKPLAIWIACWGLLITFIVTQWKKFRRGVRLVDFFRSRLKHSNYRVRIQALNAVVDFDELKKIALNDKNQKVRAAAVHRIRDEAFLLNIVLNDPKENVKVSAVKRLSNQKYLLQIVKESTVSTVRGAALKRIKDQSMLLEVALSDFPQNLRSSAAMKINDESSLKEVVFSDTLNKVKHAAIDRIRSQKLLKEIIQSNLSQATRVHAFSRITDIGIIVEIYREWPDPGPPLKAMKAVKHLKNPDWLKSLVTESKSMAVRIYFIPYIEDPDVLQYILDNDPHDEVKKRAKKYLKFFKSCYTRMQIKVDCPGCSQPVFINGPYGKVSCAYCGAESPVSELFFRQMLQMSFQKGEFYPILRILWTSILPEERRSQNALTVQKNFPLPTEASVAIIPSAVSAVQRNTVSCRPRHG